MDVRVLFVEDSADDVELMLRRLHDAGLRPRSTRVQTEEALRAALAGAEWDVALVDYDLPGFSGSRALRVLAELVPDVPAVTVSGAIDEDTAVSTLTAGAVDYVLKGNLARLAPAVQRALEGADLRRRQRQAAEQARQSQFAVDHASQAVAYANRDGTLLYLNHAAESLGGIAGADAGCRTVWDWSPIVTEPGDWARLWDDVAAGSLTGMEVVIGLPDGTRRQLSLSFDFVRREEEPFLIVYARDVTEQRDAEEKARQTEARYGRLTDTLPDMVFRYELEPEPHLAYINPAAHDLSGYSPDEFYADPRIVEVIVHPDDRAAVLGVLDHPDDVPRSMEWRLVARDGTVRWMHSLMVRVPGQDGGPLAIEGVARDITEIRRATQELAHSRDLLEYVVSHDRSAVAILDRDLRYLYVSERFIADYGLRDADIIGRRHWDVFPDLPQRVKDVHLRVLRGEVVSSERDPFPRADGSLQWVRWECRPWFEVDGSIGGVILYTEVITESVLAEQALRESEERFRRVSETIADFAYSCVKPPGGSFSFDWLTGPVERITGYADAELRAWGCWKPLVVEEDVPVFEERVTGLTPGESSVCELRIRDKQGEVRWLAAYTEMTVDVEDPSAHRLFGACQDITERKRAEDALRESEALLRGILDNLQDAFLRADPAGRLVMVSPSCARSFGYDSTDDMIGLPAENLYEESADRRTMLALMQKRGYVADHVVKGLRKDGSTFWVSLNGRLLRDEAGNVSGIEGILRDVTERRQAEDEIRRQAQQLRRTVEGAVLAMGHVVETRDPYTAGHERRVAELAVALAADLELPPTEREGLRLAALIHDIGKIAVPAEILAKPGRLSAVEFNLIKQHAQAGFEILATIEFEEPVAEIVLQHHERCDGSGYPAGLAGEQILPAARILAVADVVEAMSSHRPYRAALGLEAALAEVREGAGGRYDADVAAACLRLVEERGFTFTP